VCVVGVKYVAQSICTMKVDCIMSLALANKYTAISKRCLFSSLFPVVLIISLASWASYPTWSWNIHQNLSMDGETSESHLETRSGARITCSQYDEEIKETVDKSCMSSIARMMGEEAIRNATVTYRRSSYYIQWLLFLQGKHCYTLPLR